MNLPLVHRYYRIKNDSEIFREISKYYSKIEKKNIGTIEEKNGVDINSLTNNIINILNFHSTIEVVIYKIPPCYHTIYKISPCYYIIYKPKNKSEFNILDDNDNFEEISQTEFIMIKEQYMNYILSPIYIKNKQEEQGS